MKLTEQKEMWRVIYPYTNHISTILSQRLKMHMTFSSPGSDFWERLLFILDFPLFSTDFMAETSNFHSIYYEKKNAEIKTAKIEYTYSWSKW